MFRNLQRQSLKKYAKRVSLEISCHLGVNCVYRHLCNTIRLAFRGLHTTIRKPNPHSYWRNSLMRRNTLWSDSHSSHPRWRIFLCILYICLYHINDSWIDGSQTFDILQFVYKIEYINSFEILHIQHNLAWGNKGSFCRKRRSTYIDWCSLVSRERKHFVQQFYLPATKITPPEVCS